MASGPSFDSGMTIQNRYTDKERTRTAATSSFGSATYDSFRTHDNSAAREAMKARNTAVTSTLVAQETDIDEPPNDDFKKEAIVVSPVAGADYEEMDYEEPVPYVPPKQQPSATLL